MNALSIRKTPRRKTLPRCFAIAFAAGIAAFVSAGAAVAQYDPPVITAQSERHAPQEEGRGLFGGLFGGNEPQRRSEPRYAQQMPGHELAVRLERLEGQIRQLTGAIEQLQHRNQQLEQQVRRQQEDTEYRFQEISGRPGAAPRRAPPATQSPAPQPPAAAPSGRRSDAFDPSENPGAPGAPQALGSIPARPGAGEPSAPIYAEESPRSGPLGRDPGAPLDLGRLADRAIQDPTFDPDADRPQAGGPPVREARNIPGPLPPPPPRNTNATGAALPPQQVAVAPPSATPRDELALAQGYIQRRDYALAEESLRGFLKKYPGDRLTPDAHYWLGESLFQRRQFRDAAESFLTVSTQYEKSGRAADSLLRLGQSLAAMGEREAACATLNEVGRKFPRASASVKQTAEREQKRVRC